MEIELLNHASVKITSGAISLLSDPWYLGTCFQGGWGLKYENPDAFALAKMATHLWISHPHNDHLHFPTLKRIATENPNIQILANRSANLNMEKIFRQLGFSNIIPIDERKRLSLNDHFDVFRIPTTGIDSMLLIRSKGYTILNYNDCNLSARAIQSLLRKIGPVNILLTNFNHAGKLYEYPSHEIIKLRNIESFKKLVGLINPKWVIPFASMHYYRARSSAHQNGSLIEPDELHSVDQRILPIQIGGSVCFDSNKEHFIREPRSKLILNEIDQKTHGHSFDIEMLKADGEIYQCKIINHFWGVSFWIPRLLINIEDLETTVSFDLKSGLQLCIPTDSLLPHISLHSSSLHEWFSHPYGTDAFMIGGDFKILRNESPLHRLLLAGLMSENNIGLKDMIKMLCKKEGYSFLFNRREEIISLFALAKWRPGVARL